MDYILQSGLPEHLKKTAIIREVSSGIYCWQKSEAKEVLNWIGVNNLIVLDIDVFIRFGEEMVYTGYRWCYQGNSTRSRKENLTINLDLAGKYIDDLAKQSDFFYEILFKSESSMDEIKREFFDRAVIHRGEITFKVEDALAIIDKCREKGRRIIGFEVFLIEKTENGQTIRPMEYRPYSGKSYDGYNPEKYIATYHVNKNADAGHWEEAKQFIIDRASKGWVFRVAYE
jgi:hypothetical protein